jgi:hypothetical protein
VGTTRAIANGGLDSLPHTATVIGVLILGFAVPGFEASLNCLEVEIEIVLPPSSYDQIELDVPTSFLIVDEAEAPHLGGLNLTAIMEHSNATTLFEGPITQLLEDLEFCIPLTENICFGLEDVPQVQSGLVDAIKSVSKLQALKVSDAVNGAKTMTALVAFGERSVKLDGVVIPELADAYTQANGDVAAQVEPIAQQLEQLMRTNLSNLVVVGFGDDCIDIDHSATFVAAGSSATNLNGTLTMTNSVVNCTLNYREEAGDLFTIQAWFEGQTGNVALETAMQSTYINSGAVNARTAAIPTDSWFDTVSYIGAVKDSASDWTVGWTFKE